MILAEAIFTLLMLAQGFVVIWTVSSVKTEIEELRSETRLHTDGVRAALIPLYTDKKECPTPPDQFCHFRPSVGMTGKITATHDPNDRSKRGRK